MIYEIDVDERTECVGHNDKPTCIGVCPIDCIKKDLKHSENEQTLLVKFITMHG
jgi:ferredoxin